MQHTSPLQVLNPREPVIMGPAWKALILRLCMFHALLLERHHYGGLGWRRSYDFSAADFLSTIKQVVQVRQGCGLHSTPLYCRLHEPALSTGAAGYIC
jgi:hypothetical protein